MNRYFTSFFFVLLFVVSAGSSAILDDESQTTLIIEPHIGDNFTSVTQIYSLTEKGLTQFEILTISLSYADLHIFDDKGDLDYEIGNNIIIGRNIYRKITVYFREPVTPPYAFTVTYWYFTSATGKPLTGKYKYTIVNVTDSTTVVFDIPLTGITETSRSSPKASVEEQENSTTFTYHFSEDTIITLAYEPKESIDYSNTETKLFQNSNTFEVTYPVEAAIFLEDIAFFIEYAFPVFLKETGIPLRFDTIKIELDKEEDTWAAAAYRGDGEIRILINNTASYPSQFLAHELTHSYIGDFPRYLEEGMANYFEGRVARSFAAPRPENYIYNRESFFQTYERQFKESVDITQLRYGLGLTDHQEALIYAKYSKGTHVIYEIAYVCGEETVQEMLQVLTEIRDCDVNQLIYEISKGDEVYQILKGYKFDVVPPYAYPAEELLQEVRGESWWSRVLCFGSGFNNKIREAAPEDIEGIKADIQHTGEVASNTVLVADGIAVGVLLLLGIVIFRKVYRIHKRNPRIVYYVYFVPVAAAFVLFSSFFYEFLFNGYKFMWIARNVLAPWGLGICFGVAVVVLLVQYCPGREKMKVIVDVVWSALFFGILVMVAYFYTFWGILLGLGYAVSLVGLFIVRRRGAVVE